MTRDQLIDAISQGIARMEGYDKPGSLSERNANPGNVRIWHYKDNRSYPTFKGYVDFVQWAENATPGWRTTDEISAAATAEGWRVLKVLIGQYLDGKYMVNYPGQQPKKVETIYDMFYAYAPPTDGNDPVNYAKFVADRLGTDPHAKLSSLIA